MPISEVSARRYATALMDVATERALADRCLDDMVAFGAVVTASVELRAVFGDPTVPVQTSRVVVQRIAERLGLDATTVSFLSILATRRRLDGLDRILAEYHRERDRRAGRASGQVVSAAPVTDAQLARITAAISRQTGTSVRFTRRIDPALLGGLQVVVGDRVLDFSARTYLESLKNRLLHNR